MGRLVTEQQLESRMRKKMVYFMLDRASKTWNPDDFEELYLLFKHHWGEEVERWERLKVKELYV